MKPKADAFLEMLKRRAPVVLIVFAIGLGVLLTAAKIMPTYKANADLLIVSQAMKGTTLSDPDLPLIVTSTEVLGHVVDKLHLDMDASDLAKQITTTLPAKSSILELTYEDHNSERAASIANAIADESTVYFHQIATRGYTDVLAALNVRIAESQVRIATADKVLQKASNANFAAGSTKALEDLSRQIGELRAQSGQLTATLAADQARSASLLPELRSIDPIVPEEILQNGAANQQLEQGLAKDVEDLISKRASSQGSVSGLADLARRVKSERDRLYSLETTTPAYGSATSPPFTQTVFEAAHAAGLVDADEQRLEATNTQLLSEQDYLQRVAGVGAVINTLRAKRDAAVQQYVTLTQRLSKAQAEAAQGASLGRLVVVSRAIPGRTDLPLALMAGIFILVFVLAVASAYVCEAFDKRLWGVREIETAYGCPVFMEVGGRS